ncbi:YqcI/YcgG family-domain-containing protein [Leptodontidium sp. MPI-SDFR-AT-0119]|nr:YqcI/YcgG family-domain-containing protein [Leptodontidium sp. MPI-SDFR-AT-0119]
MATDSFSLNKLLPVLSRELLYTTFIVALGIITWVRCYSVNSSSKKNRARPVLPTTRLWTSREIPTAFAPTSWQRQAFDAFRARMLLQDPQIFPCIYATKGFKANEHRCCFIDHLDTDPGSTIPDTTLDNLAAAFEEYAQNWRQFGPMTSLVVLTPLPPATTTDEWKPTLEEDRRRFWDLLRAISDRDPHSWPAQASQTVGEPSWTFRFRGERFVALALTPRYRKRQSRFCAGFVLAFQPIEIFQDLLSTPEKMASAVGKVRELTDSLDDVPYSQDVVAVGDGRQSVSSMFFLSDDDESWDSLYNKIRSG